MIRYRQLKKSTHERGNKMEKFESTLKEMLISTYIEAYGTEAWTSKTADEKANLLHELLGSFLTVARNR